MSGGTIVFEGSNAGEVVFSQTLQLPWMVFFSHKFAVPFEDIKFEHRVYKLRYPMELLLEKVDGGWTCEDAVFSLHGFGRTNVDAVMSVFEDFSVLWEEIATADDCELSEEARRAKLTLLDFVKSVEEKP